jgi:16S rRNA (guanine966-N2)-methyltransferase
MRVSGGSGRGRRLKVPAGDRVRPTSDKVKQALFNILGAKVEGAVFLDLFAGTGSIGIEALSRGAGRTVFIDDARRSLDAVRHNIEQAGFGELAQVTASKAETFVRKALDRFDIVYVDPPYTTEIKPLLELISGSGLLAPGAVVVAEHFKKQPSVKAAGMLVLYRETVYGDTVLAFYRERESGGTK